MRGGKIVRSGRARRAEQPYQQLDALRRIRREVRRELSAESPRAKSILPISSSGKFPAGPDRGGIADRPDPDTA
jgi:hypothetical protein